jgi:hypothetical protein
MVSSIRERIAAEGGMGRRVSVEMLEVAAQMMPK